MKTHEFANKLAELRQQVEAANTHAEFKVLGNDYRCMLATYTIADTETVVDNEVKGME